MPNSLSSVCHIILTYKFLVIDLRLYRYKIVLIAVLISSNLERNCLFLQTEAMTCYKQFQTLMGNQLMAYQILLSLETQA